MSSPRMSARLGAEFLGTFWLVFGGCGSAVIAAKFLSSPDQISVGIGFLGVALAFGLTVLTMAYAVGTSPVLTSTPPSPSVWPSPNASSGGMLRHISPPRS